MTLPTEYTLVEKPIIDLLVGMGYQWLRPAKNEVARDGLNRVLLRDEVIGTVQRLNDVPEEVARAVYQDLLALDDNETWTSWLRGNLSRHVPGQPTKKTIRLVDYLHPANNTFTVTNQLTVKAQNTRRTDVVVYVNGIPLVVIEAKSPLSAKDKTGEAFEQIKLYEQDIPRLFAPNLFSIVTDGDAILYGTTGAPSAFWGRWRDPWPRTEGDFSSELEKAIWSLLEPSRLLDLLAHFVIFEKRDNKTLKKMCRYQQYRAVNKLVDRVAEGTHRRGLIWHTQGSGKSLTMVFATLKLRNHLTVDAPALANPNILVVTDRIDLDQQIAGTFQACGLPNPKQMESVQQLRDTVHSGMVGLVLLSTIYKFDGSRTPGGGSEHWIVLVDEAHRTQEKELGAFLRATLPDATYFGFTGTPVKKDDLDTYRNFGVEGEGYLDRYSIDDAVADGATVPIRYTSRKAEWQVDSDKLDVLFDQWFAAEPEEKLEAIKERGVNLAALAKHSERIKLIAYDLWTHFQSWAMPDGFKAQVVAIDRQAIVLYKSALDTVIAEDLVKDGMDPAAAEAQAAAMSVCVYSPSQEDDKPSEDPWVDDLRKDIKRFQVTGQDERDVINAFVNDPEGPKLLIVCSKLLTGFDAPVEAVMYLDSPLSEHNLLQAIARTNRVAGPKKQYGLIVDYIGVTKKLDEALASYREADVQNAMVDLDVLRQELKAAHRDVIEFIKGISRVAEPTKDNLKAEFDALIQALGTLDAWFLFRMKARVFIRAYEALAPDPAILDYTRDLKWVTGFLMVATQAFEKKESLDLKDYSAKIREILEEHLHVTGLTTLCKLRHLTDPEFWTDFEEKTEATAEDLKTAAIRKSTELKKILRDKTTENPLRFGPFSDRVLAVLQRFEAGQLSAAETLKEYEKIAKDLQAEGQAHTSSGLNERAYGIYSILKALQPQVVAEPKEPYGDQAGAGSKKGMGPLGVLAEEIDTLYGSDDSAPPGWHLKEQLKKELRQAVRRMAHRAGLPDIKKVAMKVQDYALRFYVKVA